jgi:hyperosmotically inducible protein
MRTFTQSKGMQWCAVLALAAIMIFLAGPATAAYNQGTNQSNQNQSGQGSYESSQAGSPAAGSTARNLPLERRIASQLRSQGYGQTGQIMILATGNKVILLGTVPDDNMKSGAERIAKQVSSGATVDNRLHVVKQAQQLSDTQLQTKVGDNLPGDTAKTINVQAMNGTVSLQGHVKDWAQAADVIDAAFAAGAQRVNSRLTVGAAGGYHPSYGYTPGAPPEQGQAAGPAAQASASDLRLAHQVALQLQQQLPSGQNVQTILPQSIYVSVQNGTVTLHGFVQDPDQIQQAGQIARSVQGVRNVTNDLAIFSGPSGTAGQGTSGQTGQGGTADQSNMSNQGPSGTTPPESGMSNQNPSAPATPPSGTEAQQASMSPADLALARQVVEKLHQQLSGIRNVELIRPNTIYVSARHGTVTLNGFIRNQDVPQKAAQIAKSIPGVQNVRSMLKIMGGFAPSYGYVPGQGQEGQMGQQGFQGQPGTDKSGPGTSTGPAQFSQTAYRDQSGMGNQNAGAGRMGGQQEPGSMGAPSLPPIGMSPADTALAWQVAQKLQQQLPNQWVQVVRPDTIYVVTNQGTVMLYGFVTNPSVKQHANQIAQSVSGVQHVSDSIGIAGAGAPSALGYVPGQENQPGNQQLEDNESANEESSTEEFVITEPGR